MKVNLISLLFAILGSLLFNSESWSTEIPLAHILPGSTLRISKEVVFYSGMYNSEVNVNLGIPFLADVVLPHKTVTCWWTLTDQEGKGSISRVIRRLNSPDTLIIDEVEGDPNGFRFLFKNGTILPQTEDPAPLISLDCYLHGDVWTNDGFDDLDMPMGAKDFKKFLKKIGASLSPATLGTR